MGKQIGHGSTGPGARGLRTALALAGVALLVVGIAVVVAPTEAAAADNTYLVNDYRLLNDAAPGNGVCATSAGSCTLRAALQEANATPAATTDIGVGPDLDFVTPGVQPTATVWQGTETGLATVPVATFNPGALQPMLLATAITTEDVYAWNVIAAPVTIDLDNRLAVSSVSDGNFNGAAFYVNAPNVQLRNFNGLVANETAIVASGAADNLVIEHGRAYDVSTFNLERFLWLSNGANGVTVRDVRLASLWSAGIVIDGREAGATVNDLTLDRVTMDNVADTPFDQYNGLQLWTGAATLNRLTVKGSTFNAFRNSRSPFQLFGLVLNNAVFADNTFSNGQMGVADNNFAYIRSWGSSGTGNVITRNTFQMTASMGYAIHIQGNTTNGSPGGWTITDNVFSGQNGGSFPAVELRSAGQATVRRNIFTGLQSGDGPFSENAIYTDAAFYNEEYSNNQPGTFRGIYPWYPVADGGYPLVDTAACTVAVRVRFPSTQLAIERPSTAGPSQFDVYWLPATSVDADVYLGTASIAAGSTADAVLTVPFRLGSGKVRVQTIDGAGRSSQLSRSLAITSGDSCRPTVTVDQRLSQADPTSVRDLHFQAEFSESVADGQLTAADFSTAGSTAAGATVTGVTRLGPSTFDVVARANSSGTVVVSLPAGAVSDSGGNASAASTSTDNSVTYASPLAVSPASVTVSEPAATASYLVTRAGLSASSAVTITPSVAPAVAAVGAALTLPTLASSVPGTVTAVDNQVVDGTRTASVTFVVTSADPNFDGLLLAPVSVSVDDDDTPDAVRSSLAATPDPATSPRVADATSTYTLTAAVSNSAGQPVSAAAVAFAAGPGPALSAPSCTTSAAGTCSVTVSSATPGTFPVSATVGGAAISASPANLVFTPLPASAGDSNLAATTTGVKTANDPGDPHVVTATLRDRLANPVAGEEVTFTAGGATLDPPSCTTGPSGTCSTNVVGAAPGTVQVGGAIAAGPLGGSPVSVQFGVGPASPAASRLSVTAGTRVADGVDAHTATVVVQDQFANPIAGAAGSITVGVTGGPTVGPVTETAVAGTYTATITSSTVGAYAVAATVGGVPVSGSPTTVTFGAGAPSPGGSSLTLSSGPQTVGTGAYTVTASIRDASANPVPGVEVTFAADGGATLGAATVVTDAGGVATALLTSEVAGSSSVSATIVDPGLGTAVAIGGSPVAAVFTAGAPSLSNPGTGLVLSGSPAAADGVAAVTATATVLDGFANPVPGVTVTFAVAAPASLSATMAVTGADGTAVALVRSTTAGSFAVDASIAAGALAGSPAAAQFVAGSVSPGQSSFTVTTGSRTANGSDAHTITASLRDGSGNPVSGQAATVAVQPGPFTVSAFTETGTPGRYTATVTSTVAGAKELTVVVLGAPLTGGDGVNPKQVTFVAGPPSAAASALSVSTGVRVAGVASHSATATIVDAEGNPVPGVVVTFAVTDSATVAPGTVTTDASGQATTTITATVAGVKTVSATIVEGSAPADVGATTRTVVFVPGVASASASALAITPAGPLPAGGTFTATVTVRDEFGNVVPGTTVTFSVPAAVSPSGASATAGADGTASITLTSTAAGTYEVAAAIGGTDVGASPVPVTFTAATASAARSSLVVSSGAKVADGVATHTATVTARDQYDNPVPGATVSFTYPAELSEVSAATSCTTSTSGTCTLTFTSTTAGAFTIGATVGGAAVVSAADVALFVAGSASAANSTLTVSAGTRVADGADQHTATVAVADGNGNPVGAGTTVAVDAGGVTVGSACTTDSSGSCTVSLRTTVAGTYPVTASVGGSAVGGSPTPVTFVAGPPIAASSTITASPASITADGASTSLLTVSLRDAFDNPATAGGAVVITISSSSATPGTLVGGVVDAGGGRFTQSVQAPTVPGTDTFGFTVDGTPGTATAQVTYSVGAADAGRSTIAAAPPILAVGGQPGTVTVTLRDANGNQLPSGGDTVTVAPTGGAVPDPAGVVDKGDGTYTAAFTSPSLVGTSVFRFAVNGVAGAGTASVTFVAGPSSANDYSTITASPTSVPTGGTTSTITVTVYDAYGNVRTTGGDTVTVTLASGTGTLDAAGVSDRGDGTYTISLTSPPGVGSGTVQFTVNGEVGDRTATVTYTAGAADLARSGIEASPGSITADGVSTSTLTVTLRDASGNQLGGSTDTVEIALAGGTGTVGPVTAVGGDQYTATVTAPAVVGSGTFGFTVNGAPAPATASVTYTAGAADLARSGIEASPGSITADGVSTSTLTVTLRDASGNQLGGSTDTVEIALAGGTGTVGPVTAVGGGQYTATVTAPAVVGSGTFGFTVNGAPAPATASVSYVAGAPDLARSGIVASPPSIPADGVSTSTLTVTLRDASGNPIAGASVVIVRSAGTGAPGPTTDNGDGTYSAVAVAPVVAGSGTFGFTVGGAPGGATATVAFTDQTAPPAPTVTAPVDGTTTGDATPVFAGTGEPGSTVTVTDGSGNVVCTVAVAGSGAWTCTPSAPVADGAQTFTVTQTDAAGNTGPPATVAVVVDATAPAAPAVTAPVDGATSGDATPVFAGTGEPGSTVTVTDGSGNVACTAAVGPGGDWTCSPSVPVADGAQTFTVTQTDAAGNTGPPATVAVVVDATAPGAPTVTAPAPGSTTNDATPVFAGTGEPGSTVTVTDGAGNVACTAAVGPGGDWTCSPSVPVADGAQTFTVTQTDAAGNTGPPATVEVTVDAAVPAAPVVVTPADGSATNDTTPAFAGTGEPGATVTVTDGSGNVACTATVGAGGAWACTPAAPVGDGPQTFTVTQTDASGNTGPAATIALTVDTTAPAPPVVTAPASGSATNDTTPTFAGTGEPGATITVTDAGGATACTATVGPGGDWRCSPATATADGPQRFTVVQTDRAGTTGAPATVTVTVDTAAPGAPSVGPTTGSAVSGTGGEPGSTIVVTTAAGAPVCRVAVATDGSWTCTPATAVPPGTTLVVVAIDAAGNESPPVNVVVLGPPPAPVALAIELSLPSVRRGTTQTARARGFQPGETVSATMFSDPVALGTQVADATGTVTFTWYIGAQVDLGTHTITATGPSSGSVSATFVVYDVATLPATGAEVTDLLGVAAAAAGIGFLLLSVALGRRRAG